MKEVVARHLQDDTISIVATRNTTMSQPHTERYMHVVEALKGVVALLCAQPPCAVSDCPPTAVLHTRSAGTPCAALMLLLCGLLLLKPCSHAVGRSVGFPGQGVSARTSGTDTYSRAAPSHRCQSARPPASSSRKATCLAARMRPQTASAMRSGHYPVGAHTGTAENRPFDTPHSGGASSSLGSWQSRVEQRVRIDVLVKAAAKEQKRLEAGRRPQSLLRTSWRLQPSVQSLHNPTSGTNLHHQAPLKAVSHCRADYAAVQTGPKSREGADQATQPQHIACRCIRAARTPGAHLFRWITLCTPQTIQSGG